MLSELGFFFLVMAIGFSAVQMLSSLWGVLQNSNRYLVLGKVATYLQGGFVGAAFCTLLYAFYVNDFSVSAVMFHSHTELPWYYRIAASWGNHEGSLLLFILILSMIAVLIARFLSSTSSLLKERTLVIQGGLVFSFLLFLILSSNPFAPLPFSLTEGNSLNPLLQDRSLMLHPPILYFGYVGFSAPFSIALAALWAGEDIKTWTTAVRPWALIAWSALTAGITLGSWWAYYELGWGGWWFWDPVENASFMPWLAGTALLHALRTERLYRWSLFLSLLTFQLSLMGTFLVRSGLVASVHSFSQDTSRSLFILGLFVLIFIFSLGIWAIKGRQLSSQSLDYFSQKGILFLNSLLLFGGLLIIVLGTVYPLALDWILGAKVAVGAPYFEYTFVPLIIPLFVLIPISFFMKEKKDSLFSLFLVPLTITLAVIVSFLYLFSLPSLWVLVGVALGIWILSGTGFAYLKKNLTLGPTLSHLGVGISLLGVSLAGGMRTDEAKIFALKETADIAGVRMTLEDVKLGKESTYIYEKATLSSAKGTATPEKRFYQPQKMMLSETSILTNGFQDIYVILGPYQGDNKWLIRVSTLPLAPWIWIGGAFMALGAILSLFRRKLVFMLFLCFLPTLTFAEKSIEQRAQEIYKEVRCPVCTGQSIAESDNPESTAFKSFILDQLEEGKSEAEIRDDLRILFGDEILFRPPLDTKTYLLWVIPFFIFLILIIGFMWKFHRSRFKKN